MTDDAAMRLTNSDVLQFLNAVEPERRRIQGLQLLEMFAAETGVEPQMWGPTIVGFGRLRYTYATGRSGEMPRVGFSPRKASLSLYGLTLYGSNADLLEKLGKHKVGKGCLYINKFEDIDVDVLRDMIRRAWQESADDFVASHAEASVESLDGR